jgi:hypothetical protein
VHETDKIGAPITNYADASSGETSNRGICLLAAQYYQEALISCLNHFTPIPRNIISFDPHKLYVKPTCSGAPSENPQQASTHTDHYQTTALNVHYDCIAVEHSLGKRAAI